MENATSVRETKTSYSHEEILRCAQGEYFGMDSAKLPLPNMLMLDRIVSISEDGGKYGKGELIAELDINPEQWFFACHFVGDPVMPGCLGLDAMWQLTGFFLSWKGHRGKGRALGVGEVRFSGQILPTNKLVTYHIHIKRIVDRDLIMAISDGIVSVDGEEIYEAKSLRVGFFKK